MAVGRQRGLELGWEPRDAERPNFWQIFDASHPSAGDVSHVLVRTLTEVCHYPTASTRWLQEPFARWR